MTYIADPIGLSFTSDQLVELYSSLKSLLNKLQNNKNIYSFTPCKGVFSNISYENNTLLESMSKIDEIDKDRFRKIKSLINRHEDQTLIYESPDGISIDDQPSLSQKSDIDGSFIIQPQSEMVLIHNNICDTVYLYSLKESTIEECYLEFSADKICVDIRDIFRSQKTLESKIKNNPFIFTNATFDNIYSEISRNPSEARILFEALEKINNLVNKEKNINDPAILKEAGLTMSGESSSVKHNDKWNKKRKFFHQDVGEQYAYNHIKNFSNGKRLYYYYTPEHPTKVYITYYGAHLPGQHAPT